MGHIQEPPSVDFIVDSRTSTAQDHEAMLGFIAKKNAAKKEKKTPIVPKKRKKTGSVPAR